MLDKLRNAFGARPEAEKNVLINLMVKQLSSIYWARVFKNVAVNVFNKGYGPHDLYIAFDEEALVAGLALAKINDGKLAVDLTGSSERHPTQGQSFLERNYFAHQCRKARKISALFIPPKSEKAGSGAPGEPHHILSDDVDEYLDRYHQMNLLQPRSRVCLIARDYLHKDDRVSLIIKGFCRRGHPVDVFSFSDKPPGLLWPFPDRLRYIGIDQISPGSRGRVMSDSKAFGKTVQTKAGSTFPVVEQSNRLNTSSVAVQPQLRKGAGLDHTKKEQPSTIDRFTNRLFDFSDKCEHILKDQKPFDAIIAHEFASLIAGNTIREGQQEPAVLVFDNVEYPDVTGRSVGGELTKLSPQEAAMANDLLVDNANSSNFCLATSPGQMKKLKMMGVKKPIHVVRNLRDTDRRIPELNDHTVDIRKLRAIATNSVILLHMNNIYQDGGFETLLKSLKTLPDNFVLAFIGKHHKQLDRLQTQAVDLGVAHRTFMLDPVPPDKILPLAASADISVIPLPPGQPNYETSLPNRIFDSLAANLPLVAIRGTETAALVDEFELGTTAASNTPEELAVAIEKAWAQRRYTVRKIALFKQANNWKTEFFRPLEKIVSDKKDGRLLLLANKNIETNSRVHRITRSLVEAGWRVTIVARKQPHRDLLVRDVTYFQIG